MQINQQDNHGDIYGNTLDAAVFFVAALRVTFSETNNFLDIV